MRIREQNRQKEIGVKEKENRNRERCDKRWLYMIYSQLRIFAFFVLWLWHLFQPRFLHCSISKNFVTNLLNEYVVHQSTNQQNFKMAENIVRNSQFSVFIHKNLLNIVYHYFVYVQIFSDNIHYHKKWQKHFDCVFEVFLNLLVFIVFSCFNMLSFSPSTVIVMWYFLIYIVHLPTQYRKRFKTTMFQKLCFFFFFWLCFTCLNIVLLYHMCRWSHALNL